MNFDLKKLNLGSGKYPMNGYINLDIDKKSNVDIIHDLEVFPWPLPDNYFEIIRMDHILEHLNDIRKTLQEIDRILINGGQVIIRVPHFSRGFTHWDHKHGFDVSFPLYLDNGISGGFSNINLVHDYTRLIWFGQPEYKRKYLHPISYFLGKIFGELFNLLGNLDHYFTSRILCFWVGGFDEIEFVFKKKVAEL